MNGQRLPEHALVGGFLHLQKYRYDEASEPLLLEALRPHGQLCACPLSYEDKHGQSTAELS